jgi:hypothetical protein
MMTVLKKILVRLFKFAVDPEALHRHTVEVADGGCWTVLLTGKVVRRWGFWVNGKFKKTNKYFLEHGHHPCK